MRKFPAIVILALAVGCAGTPENEDESSAKDDSLCPTWKIPVEDGSRIICVDRDVLERERELIEREEDWW